MGHRKEIRVFISSPGDCSPEREAVKRVLDELNRTVGEREKLYFQDVRWEDIPPGLGNPQTVIDEHLGSYNVLVGIMWLRFGTPIPGGAGSGTEHEFQQAAESWKLVGAPRVMFYFKQDPPKDLFDIDNDQFKKVREFMRRLQEAALVQTFHGTSEFESKLRVHLHKLVDYLLNPIAPSPDSISAVEVEPYEGFHKSFREVVGALRVPKKDSMLQKDSMLHVVFGSIADIREMPVVIPVGQAFDFRQRGPRSVLASFENIRVGQGYFFDEIETLWPVDNRPKAAGLGHTKYLPLPANSQQIPGVFFVVTTRDLSKDAAHYGIYTHTPIEGIDYIIDRVIEAAKRNHVQSIALPLLGTGYANVRRTMDDVQLGRLLQQTVTLLAIQKLEDALKDQSSALRRAVVVVFSRDPQGPEEHDLWKHVTRFLGSHNDQRKKQLEQVLSSISELCI